MTITHVYQLCSKENSLYQNMHFSKRPHIKPLNQPPPSMSRITLFYFKLRYLTDNCQIPVELYTDLRLYVIYIKHKNSHGLEETGDDCDLLVSKPMSFFV